MNVEKKPIKLTMYSYERIVSRIAQNLEPAMWKIARELLGWMICAKRPLRWHEIQGAFSTDLVAQTVDFENRKLRLDIRELCGSLIQVLPGHRLELVHSTAKLSVKHILLPEAPDLIFNAAISLIAATCARQLSNAI
jgi:hypothetical protein